MYESLQEAAAILLAEEAAAAAALVDGEGRGGDHEGRVATSRLEPPTDASAAASARRSDS